MFFFLVAEYQTDQRIGLMQNVQDIHWKFAGMGQPKTLATKSRDQTLADQALIDGGQDQESPIHSHVQFENH